MNILRIGLFCLCTSGLFGAADDNQQAMTPEKNANKRLGVAQKLYRQISRQQPSVQKNIDLNNLKTAINNYLNGATDEVLTEELKIVRQNPKILRAYNNLQGYIKNALNPVAASYTPVQFKSRRSLVFSDDLSDDSQMEQDEVESDLIEHFWKMDLE